MKNRDENSNSAHLLSEVQEAIFILVKEVEHVEALLLRDVVHHVVLQELVDVVGANLAETHAVDSLEGCPRLESMLLRKLLALLFHYFFILRNGLQEEVDLVTS